VDDAGRGAAQDFVLELGRGLHRYGYPSHRLEQALEAASHRLGLQGQFFSTPTALFASFGGHSDQRTFQLRMDPGMVDLAKLAALDAITRDVALGRLAPAGGSEAIRAVVAAPPAYGPALTTVCFALASGTAARFLGGGPREAVAATVIGLGLGLLALLAGRLPGLARVFEPVAALLAAFLAAAMQRQAGPLSAYVVTLAGLIILVPGFSLTVAMTELATRHLVSGTARLMGAAGTFLAIGFGVALGTRLGAYLPGTPEAAPAPAAWPEWTLPAALVIAPLSFAVLLRAAPRDVGAVVLAGVLAFSGARAGAGWLGPELGPFLGALAVGLWGNAYARLRERPSAVAVVPGLLLLVPGSLGFHSFSSLLGRDTLPGVESAFRMALGAVSLVTGLLFANVLLPPPPLVAGDDDDCRR
jgi:uncharacterized membrane protein YjjP (DUF1212 family)